MLGGLFFEVLTQCQQTPFYWCRDIMELTQERVQFPDLCTLDVPADEPEGIMWRVDTSSACFGVLTALMRRCLTQARFAMALLSGRLSSGVLLSPSLFLPGDSMHCPNSRNPATPFLYVAVAT